MINKPHFKPSYSVEIIAPDQVFLLSERETIWLSDRISCRVAFLLKENHYSIDEIIEIIQLELLQEQKPTQQNSAFFQNVLDVSVKTQYALFQMEQQGYLVEQNDSLPSHLAIFCHHLNITPTAAYLRLQSTKIAIKPHPSLPTADLIAILESLHIQVSDQGQLTVVLTDDYLHPDLEAFNQQALKSQSPWMLVNPLGTKIWIGPIFHPHKTGCWQCLARRLRNNRPIERFIQKHKSISTPISPPLGFLSSTVQTALGMVATEIFKWIIQGGNQQLEGTLLTYDTLTLQTENHILIKRPQSPSNALVGFCNDLSAQRSATLSAKTSPCQRIEDLFGLSLE